jgi:hypothetical protein
MLMRLMDRYASIGHVRVLFQLRLTRCGRFSLPFHHPQRHSTMPCPDDAKNWQPDAVVQGLIERLADLTVVSERCAAHLRSFDSPTLNQLWATVQAEFRADPVRYPSIRADKTTYRVGGFSKPSAREFAFHQSHLRAQKSKYASTSSPPR